MKLTLTLLFSILFVGELAAETLDPQDVRNALAMQRKVLCSTVDGEPTTFWWAGSAYSRRQGERDRLLFDVEGMNVRACVSDTHPERGEGYRMVSRELLIYRDAETGEALSTWQNPWSGETVDVLHVANDPVNHSTYVRNRDGTPLNWGGMITEGQWRMNITVPLFYPNPLASAYQKQIGGTYHATEMFNFFGATDELLDPATTTVARQVGWARVSDWLPWMNMQGREGIIYMHTAGLRLSSWNALPDRMKEEIEAHYPDYRNPPPLDDDRVNVTSWMYYQRVAEGEVVAPDRSE
ncbi:MAG: DUF1838 family protein [Gammaproteobacteria bacterium]|nr:DUF1838 family protein [Gammaproteobacteria bacterium]